MKESIRDLLIYCLNSNNSSLGFNLQELMSGKTIEFECEGMFPTTEEVLFSNCDKGHQIKSRGIKYTVDSLPEDLFENHLKRVHTISVNKLHEVCVFNYISYFEYENAIANSNANPTRNFFNEFENCYKMIIQTTDIKLMDCYRRYWKEVSGNNAFAIHLDNTPLSAALNNSIKMKVMNTIDSFYNKI